MLREILDIITNDNMINEMYFMIARSRYLIDNETHGVLVLISNDPEPFLNYLKHTGPMPQLDISYDTTSYTEKYDPNTQFIIVLNGLTEIINKKIPRTIFYNKIICDTDIDMNEYILNSQCVSCQKLINKKLNNPPFDHVTCERCDKNVQIKSMYECTYCCTQYVYT